ncbi:hypothetical protein SUGI_0280330 [Cryptomeria japonica]|nr:hypothetical protein SUGI_0280330 [Cryptomeria japonica]
MLLYHLSTSIAYPFCLQLTRYFHLLHGKIKALQSTNGLTECTCMALLIRNQSDPPMVLQCNFHNKTNWLQSNSTFSKLLQCSFHTKTNRLQSKHTFLKISETLYSKTLNFPPNGRFLLSAPLTVRGAFIDFDPNINRYQRPCTPNQKTSNQTTYSLIYKQTAKTRQTR